VARFVAYFDADHAQAAAAEGAGLGAQHLYLDGRGFAWFQRSQLTDAQVTVAAGDAVEEVADGADSGRSRGLGGFRPDALQGAQANVEDARTRPVDWGVEQGSPVEVAGAGEGARYWAASSHHQLG
jgi:hypothetical protein